MLERKKQPPRRRPSATVLLLLSLTYGYHAADGAVSVPAHDHRRRYTGKAFVDARSPIAASKETSQVPVHSTLHNMLVLLNERDLLDFARAILAPYPRWLARFAVTGGLLQAVPDQQGGWKIQARFLGIDFLTMGPVNGQRVTYPLLMRNLGDSSRDFKYQISKVTVTLPITGGILALSNKDSHRPDDCGVLCLTLTRKRRIKSDGTDDSGDVTCTVQTELRGYHPALLGNKNGPVSGPRKWLYLRTQSVLHNYVMRRFHRYITWGTHDGSGGGKKESSSRINPQYTLYFGEMPPTNESIDGDKY